MAHLYAGGLVASEALKAIYNRGRPPKEYRLVESDNEGFPSGHAFVDVGLRPAGHAGGGFDQAGAPSF